MSSTVFLDIRAMQSPQYAERGIARYVAEHAAALTRGAPQRIEKVLLTRSGSVPKLADLFSADRRGWIEDTLAPRRGQIFHVMSPFEAWLDSSQIWPAVMKKWGVRLAVTLYDLIPLLYPDAYLADPKVRAWYKNRIQMVRDADIVFAISRSTAKDACRLLGIPPKRVHVIGGGVSDDAFHPPRTDAQAVVAGLQQHYPKLRIGYFFYAGGMEFRKNLEGMVRAHAALPPVLRRVHQLVITCAMTDVDRVAMMGLARALGSNDDIVLTGYVPDSVLRDLYGGAHATVFPSLYEGFGLPIIEAARCGAPVLASNTSSMPEVIPSVEGLFDPTNEGALTAILRRTIDDAAFLARLRRASTASAATGVHTWDKTALATLEGYGGPRHV